VAASTRVVIARTQTRSIAITVDSVLGVSAITSEALGDLPPLLRDAAPDTITAIGRLDDELIVFLRITRVVPEGVFDRLNAEKATL